MLDPGYATMPNLAYYLFKTGVVLPFKSLLSSDVIDRSFYPLVLKSKEFIVQCVVLKACGLWWIQALRKQHGQNWRNYLEGFRIEVSSDSRKIPQSSFRSIRPTKYTARDADICLRAQSLCQTRILFQHWSRWYQGNCHWSISTMSTFVFMVPYSSNIWAC